MSTVEKPVDTDAARKTGRPRKFPPGRVSVYVRLTRQRGAELKTEAQSNGRSVSEQVEFLIEDHARIENLTQDLLAQINDQFDQIRKLQQQNLKLKGENLKLQVHDDGVTARITALERTVASMDDALAALGSRREP